MKSISTFLCLVASITPSLTQITLGTAETFGVIAVAGITSTGATFVNGSIGTTGKTVVGFPPGIITGLNVADTGVTQPRADSLAAYNAARALTSNATLAASIGGVTITPGVYKFAKTATIIGNITLSGAGQYVFNVESELATDAGSNIILTDGAVASDVFWTVGSSVVLASDTTFTGSLMADGKLTVGDGTIINGGIYSGSFITLTANTITAPAA